MTLKQAILNLEQLIQHPDLRFLNAQEMGAMFESIKTLKDEIQKQDDTDTTP